MDIDMDQFDAFELPSESKSITSASAAEVDAPAVPVSVDITDQGAPGSANSSPARAAGSDTADQAVPMDT